jgi:polysaccharide biosynthesis protein PslG
MSGSRRGSRGRRSGALAAAAALALGAAPAGAAAGAPPGSASYGLVASNANFLPSGSHEARVAAYRRLYDAGVRAVRLDLNWIDVEPQGPPYKDFSFAARDAEVHAATEAGMKVIGILAYGHPDYSERGALVERTPAEGGLPPFAAGNANHFPPDDPADFADYARATAAHHGDEVIGWEIWNEQNGGWRFWPPREDPGAYAELLCAAHDAIREVDAATPVVYGGVFYPAVPPGLPGMSGPDFVRASYEASERPLGTCFDAMAYHPYPYPFTAPELDVPIRGSVLSARDEMRAAMPPADRDAKPLWITEVGWPTHDRTYGVSEAKQAQYVARMQAATFAQGVPVLTWYTYGDGEDPTGGANQEAWFGFFRADGTPKPSYRALATFARVFDGARFAGDLSAELGLPAGGPPRADVVGGRGFALEYERAGERIVALWHASESLAEAQGPLPPGGEAPPKDAPRVRLPVAAASVRVVDHLGGERTLAAEDGVVELELGPAPVYVVEALPGS